VYGMGWSERVADSFKFRFAIGSFREEYTNKVDIVQYSEEKDEFVRRGGFDHPYPTTKISWVPDPEGNQKDLIATSGDYLRIWRVDPADNGTEDVNVQRVSFLINSKSPDYCAPLTSLDWNAVDTSLIGTSSIDTTCTIWNIETGTNVAQLIAHDEEVYDIAFASRSKDVFASAGADGSVRVFDMRELERSSIVYEGDGDGPQKQALLRLAWNKQDPNFLAIVGLNSGKTLILDQRIPLRPYAELSGHQACVNAVAWAPHSSCHVCSVAEDAQALIWELPSSSKVIDEPILAYKADSCINQLQWSSATPDWVGIAFDNKVQVLRV
jgi:WD repeat-containing protein 68